ncbi:MAG: hypothetical protein NZ853_06665 [Leptospiraceae bacterium]|nr:hypothetical protein [Leptospiraceae bacterium]MDW7975885.1 hypothetical protein [Leptospiraceae bacterium]
MKTWMIYVFLLISIFFGALGQIFMKIMMNSLGPFPIHQISNWFIYFLSAIKSFYLWLIFLSYGISVILWLITLSYADLSFVRPLMSLGYLITLLYGIYAGENVTTERFLGTIFILIGVFLISKSY